MNPSHTAAMKHRFHELAAAREGQVIGLFGEARLIRHLDGRLDLVGGSAADREEAKAWAKRFLPRADARPREPQRWR